LGGWERVGGESVIKKTEVPSCCKKRGSCQLCKGKVGKAYTMKKDRSIPLIGKGNGKKIIPYNAPQKSTRLTTEKNMVLFSSCGEG